jgi:hypothetical protein
MVLQVWKLKKIGYDMNMVTGDEIGVQEYAKEHSKVTGSAM